MRSPVGVERAIPAADVGVFVVGDVPTVRETFPLGGWRRVPIRRH
jgi:hypothetical protein